MSAFSNLIDTIQSAEPQLTTYYNSISGLENQINGITFSSNNQLYQFFSTLRYLTGDIIYLTSFSIVSLFGSFYVFRLLKKFVGFVFGTILNRHISLP